ncbi:GNAT family N-acetyltransferase [Microbacterium sp.]|jgi:predicted GNAT family acetyltransferase|uniref:GNAT family N-acetyltransferase n=1 Tax=Microbacterium sp. TaxID=51671 RepID=UPI003C7111ED
MPDITVSRNDEASRYEIRFDGTLAGFAEFDRRPDEFRFVHTEIDHAFQGRGLAQQLAAAALADAAGSADVIAPYCPFIAGYLEKHPLEDVEIRLPRQG